MSNNEIMVREATNLAVYNSTEHTYSGILDVKYSLADSSKYAFEYKTENADVHMFESDSIYDSNQFVDADFSSSIDEKDYSYYAVAAASGLLTGVLNQFDFFAKNTSQSDSQNEKKRKDNIVKAAKAIGCSKSDYKDAITFIRERMVPFVTEEIEKEYDDGLKKCVTILSNHPTVVGLAFSILAQFSGEKCILDTDDISSEKVPEYYVIGKNNTEKIILGFLYWVFNLSVDIALSKRPLLDDMRIPKAHIKALKGLLNLPLFETVPCDYESAEEIFSKWIQSIFGEAPADIDEEKNPELNLEEKLNTLKNAYESSTMVMINESITRAFYLIKKLSAEIREKDVRTLADLEKVNPENILPFNNRLISRMIVISSGCFAGINVASATAKAVAKGKKDRVDFARTLLTEIDIAGVGRFIFACVADSKYWGDDLKVVLNRKEKSNKKIDGAEAEKIIDEIISNEIFKAISLNPVQTRALQSLETLIVLKDIEHTKDVEVRERKQKWLDLWQRRILSELNLDIKDYFITDENTVYAALCSVEQSNDNLRWFYLLAAELAEFRPYYPLGTGEDDLFKKLQREKYNYVDDQFVRRQIIVNQAEIDKIRAAYKKYKGIISGNTQKTKITAGASAVAALATGGLAFAFAPGIATLLAGEAVVGLHGAALTSASLAFVGGGSLASGGLGMAGGTAIITSGGALFGIAGTGSASMATLFFQTGSEHWVRQTTKLLTFCKCILKEKFNDIEAIRGLLIEIRRTIDKVERNIKEVEDEKCSLDKEALKISKDCLKYFRRCESELKKMLQYNAK